MHHGVVNTADKHGRVIEDTEAAEALRAHLALPSNIHFAHIPKEVARGQISRRLVLENYTALIDYIRR